MQHLSFQDILTILGPILALMGVMWYHSNGQFKEIREEIRVSIKEVKGEIKEVRRELKEEIRGLEEKIRGEIGEIKKEIGEMKLEMKGMEIRLTDKIDVSHTSLNEQISTERARVGRVEGHLALFPTTSPQTETSEKKQFKSQVS